MDGAELGTVSAKNNRGTRAEQVVRTYLDGKIRQGAP